MFTCENGDHGDTREACKECGSCEDCCNCNGCRTCNGEGFVLSDAGKETESKRACPSCFDEPMERDAEEA